MIDMIDLANERFHINFVELDKNQAVLGFVNGPKDHTDYTNFTYEQLKTLQENISTLSEILTKAIHKNNQ